TQSSRLLAWLDRENVDWLLFPFVEHWTQPFDLNIVWQTFTCILIDQDGALGFFCMILNSCREIYGVTNTGISSTVLGSRITSDHPAGCDANPYFDLDLILGSL